MWIPSWAFKPRIQANCVRKDLSSKAAPRQRSSKDAPLTWKLISGANSPVAQKTDILSIARTLGHVAAIWLDPADPFRQEAIIALQVSTGYASSMIEDALKSAFEELTEPKLLDFIAKEPGFQNPSELGRVLHILAGNVFTAWLPGAVTTLLLGAGCDLKPASREPVFPRLWKQSVERVDRVLAAKIKI